ncbi:hypothetical protein BaRGS_00033449 [Batillaria attramentaria]|uniref:Uncharacterized protein n=1 Tax=Batillaria attramentaria TaxID=370345 RepID=A0ABD0JK55_9CAEN
MYVKLPAKSNKDDSREKGTTGRKRIRLTVALRYCGLSLKNVLMVKSADEGTPVDSMSSPASTASLTSGVLPRLTSLEAPSKQSSSSEKPPRKRDRNGFSSTRSPDNTCQEFIVFNICTGHTHKGFIDSDIHTEFTLLTVSACNVICARCGYVSRMTVVDRMWPESALRYTSHPAAEIPLFDREVNGNNLYTCRPPHTVPETWRCDMMSNPRSRADREATLRQSEVWKELLVVAGLYFGGPPWNVAQIIVPAKFPPSLLKKVSPFREDLAHLISTAFLWQWGGTRAAPSRTQRSLVISMKHPF